MDLKKGHYINNDNTSLRTCGIMSERGHKPFRVDVKKSIHESRQDLRQLLIMSILEGKKNLL